MTFEVKCGYSDSDKVVIVCEKMEALDSGILVFKNGEVILLAINKDQWKVLRRIE